MTQTASVAGPPCLELAREALAMGRLDRAERHLLECCKPPGAPESVLVELIRVATALNHDAVVHRAFGLLVAVAADPAAVLKVFGDWLAARSRLVEAAGCLRRAIELQPDKAALHNNLGAILLRAGQLDPACDAFTEATRLDPGLTGAHSNLGTAQYLRRRLPEARAAYLAAAASDPAFIYPRVQALSVARESCDWRDWSAEVAALVACQPGAANTAPQLDLLFIPLSAQQLRAHAESYARAPAPAVIRRPPQRVARGERIRIGYVSDELRDHVVGLQLVEVLERHDRRAVDVHVFDWGKPTTSMVERRARRASAAWHDLAALSDEQAAARIAALGIDILVDLKGYTTDHRIGIFRRRPAPLQVSWLGYPGTLGDPAIDYIVADPVVIPPDAAQGYCERILRLPLCYMPSDRNRPVGDPGSRAAHGLPAEGTVFCHFGRSGKLNPETFDDWIEILQGVPGSVLWLRADGELARANLLREAAARGLAPERLVFARDARLRYAELIGRYRLADVALDTHPYGSHATASEALWAGCPIVTRVGPGFASRVAASLLHAAGLEALVTADREAYRAVAIALGNDPEARARHRRYLTERRDTLAPFDTPRLTRALESGFAAIHDRRLQGLPPADVDVSPGP
jgi:predicted O-linked N-acetylglucosamine transferase (SPINDLY family)